MGQVLHGISCTTAAVRRACDYCSTRGDNLQGKSRAPCGDGPGKYMPGSWRPLPGNVAAVDPWLSRQPLSMSDILRLIVPDAGVQIKDFARLVAGDLLFFDADPNDGTRIDHVGMYLGLDVGHHHRFISSRKGANGPTLGDYRGKSILDGAGLYARSFRAVRRL
jgi:hypothetical protein